MYSMSSAFNAAAGANTRRIFAKALFNGTEWLNRTDLIDMTVTEATNASSGLSMGATIASKLVMNLKMPETPLILTDGIVKPYVGFYTGAVAPQVDSLGTLMFSPIPTTTSDGVLILSDYMFDAGILTSSEDYCPLGKFHITDAVSSSDFASTVTITGYDGFCKTEDKYEPKITMPNTAKAILTDIATQCNFEISTGITYPDGEFELYDFTCRQYIGYFAGLVGKNARFNRLGRLTFCWYTPNNVQVLRDQQYMGGVKRLTTDDFTVHSISSGTSDNMLVSGSGIGISFENPFMTQDKLNSIATEVGNPTFTPATVKWRGNPAVEAGDIITVESKTGEFHQLYVMEQTIKIGGGMYSEIKCFGDSEAAIQFETSPTATKLKQVYTKLQEAIVEATTLLNGANGGVFEITDENGDGINDGWIIHSADNQRFIKANLNGIGITTDGGATYQQAMTTNGINASVINTGSLNAERIAVENYDKDDPTKLTDYIHFGDGTITLGKGENAITLKLENEQVAFYDSTGTRKGAFLPNGFEVLNLQDGKIRFQNFGYITRSSGNLSWTILK